jgi:hypothetical protein
VEVGNLNTNSVLAFVKMEEKVRVVAVGRLLLCN